MTHNPNPIVKAVTATLLANARGTSVLEVVKNIYGKRDAARDHDGWRYAVV
jgi:hypothetical protein